MGTPLQLDRIFHRWARSFPVSTSGVRALPQGHDRWDHGAVRRRSITRGQAPGTRDFSASRRSGEHSGLLSLGQVKCLK